MYPYIDNIMADIGDLKNDIRVLQEKNRELSEKLRIIDDMDYYKYRIRMVSSNPSYKSVISNIHFLREVEAIFNMPFDECLPYYKELLDKRNRIVHRYTMSYWSEQNTISDKTNGRRSLEEMSELINLETM